MSNVSLPLMTGNGLKKKNMYGEDWGMVYDCFIHIIWILWDDMGLYGLFVLDDMGLCVSANGVFFCHKPSMEKRCEMLRNDRSIGNTWDAE